MSRTPPKVVIKKYENRRLYDPQHSRYVNVDDVARLIREGVDGASSDTAGRQLLAWYLTNATNAL